MTSTHLAMDYREIDTAAEILAAFKGCANAGEEIQIFESLAEREHPPVGEFVTILKEIKLETALALAIQAFGKIKDDEIKAGLKGSSDLLVLLCEQAKSGSTDLIRWSAATTIEKIGFDFIAVSRHLTEEPEVIIQRIVQSKVKVLTDAERNRHGIKENNDYDSFIRFWVYGATYELRSATVNSGGGNAAIVVNAVVKAQSVWGIKQTNFLFQVLESQTSLEYNKKKVYENKLFEQDSQLLSADLLKQNQNSTNSQVLVANQIHCLQSDTALLRKKAALVLLSIDSDILNIFEQQNHALKPMIDIFNKDYFGTPDNFCYKEVVKYINFLEIADQYLSRDDACKYCQQIHSKLLNFIKNRKKEINVVERNTLFSMQLTQDTLREIESTFPCIHEKYYGVDFGMMPKVDVKDDNWQIILNQYHEKIRLNAEELNKEIALEEEERKIRIRRENRIADKFKAIDLSKKYIIDTLNVAKMLYPEVYDNYCNFDFEELPEVNTENDKWQVVLTDYHTKIITITTRLDKSIKESRLKHEQLKKEEKIQEELNRRDRQEEENRVKYEENKRQEKKRIKVENEVVRERQKKEDEAKQKVDQKIQKRRIIRNTFYCMSGTLGLVVILWIVIAISSLFESKQPKLTKAQIQESQALITRMSTLRTKASEISSKANSLESISDRSATAYGERLQKQIKQIKEIKTLRNESSNLTSECYDLASKYAYLNGYDGKNEWGDNSPRVMLRKFCPYYH